MYVAENLYMYIIGEPSCSIYAEATSRTFFGARPFHTCTVLRSTRNYRSHTVPSTMSSSTYSLALLPDQPPYPKNMVPAGKKLGTEILGPRSLHQTVNGALPHITADFRSWSRPSTNQRGMHVNVGIYDWETDSWRRW